MITTFPRWIAPLVLLAACEESNPYYCEGAPDNNCALATADAGPMTCTSSAECSGATPVCDTVGGTCVQCVAPDEIAACTGTTPICDTDHTCRGCETHADCASATCLPDGSCADTSQVAYVSAAGSGSDCTQATPCARLADAVDTNKPYIKIAADGADNDSNRVVIDGKVVTIVAELGATLDRDGDGPILEVRSAGADVSIYDVTLTGATGSAGDAVLLTPNGGTPALSLVRVVIKANQGSGVSTSGGTLTITQSTITMNKAAGVTSTGGTVAVSRATLTNNQGGGIITTGTALTVARSTLASNLGGGISVAGTGASFDITNNFIYRNGDQDNSTFGGVNLNITTAGANVFAFNTVVDNRALLGATRSGGVICDITGFTAPNNILARNTLSGSATETNSQTLGTCTYPTSLIQNDVAGLAFASPDTNPFSYKLTAGSTAIDAATTTSTIVVDHDGDARPQGTEKDCGADELVP